MNPIEEALLLKKELDNLRPLQEEQERRIMQKFRLDWNYHSNHIEGNSLSYGETKALLMFGITAQGKPLSDHLEMQGHNEAVNWVMDVVKGDRPLTETFIRELHKLLLQKPYQVSAETSDGKPASKTVNIGQYKRLPNHVRTATGETFFFATPEETPAMMQELIEWYREMDGNPKSNPILLAAEFHYRFIRIHPFDDGNGRTARLLMNFILLRHGYPPVIIKTEDKRNYLSALEQADAGMLSAFLDYIGKNLVDSLNLMIRGAQGENIDEPDDVDKKLEFFAKLLEVDERTVAKSADAIASVIHGSLIPVFNEAKREGSKFARFYTDRFSYVTTSETQRPLDDIVRSSPEDQFSYAMQTGGEKKIFIVNAFYRFRHQEYLSTNHLMIIAVRFMEWTYIVAAGDLAITKKYSQSLTESEISQLVKIVTEEHTALVESIYNAESGK
ncbi:Fic/DOC family protein [Dyadobacter sp. SG02]|uniref:Fic family protein n=1 Tax=Dyadobacter sp. SG02 TaxID=1855291 RepID=UPI0008B5C59D|nr:Fic family protein [Dyadobacter sp. SG02]SEI43336.1 Fic/DOC family protein [Dyadobacter sp. SG02]